MMVAFEYREGGRAMEGSGILRGRGGKWKGIAWVGHATGPRISANKR